MDLHGSSQSSSLSNLSQQKQTASTSAPTGGRPCLSADISPAPPRADDRPPSCQATRPASRRKPPPRSFCSSCPARRDPAGPPSSRICSRTALEPAPEGARTAGFFAGFLGRIFGRLWNLLFIIKLRKFQEGCHILRMLGLPLIACF